LYKNDIQAHLYVLLATFLVAGSFIASEKLSTILNPFSLTLLRFVGGIVILAPFILLNKKLRAQILSTLPRASIISLFYAFYFVGMFEALKTTTVLNTGSLYTLVPLLTTVFAFFIFKEKISFKKFVVYIIGLIGTLWVIFKGNTDLLMAFSLNNGDYIYLLGCLSMCAYSISIKLLYKDDNIWVLVFSTLIGGAFWMSLFMIILQEPLAWNLIQGNLVFNMAYLIIATTIVTLYLYQKTTVYLGPNKVMSYIYLNPIAVALLLFIIEKEVIELIVVPGIIITSIATIILQINKKRIT